jgi:hypothetical protein
MQLELQPPNIEVRTVGDIQRAGAFLQQRPIALIMPFLALRRLVVEARHEWLAAAKTIP